ncbi:MAG TPA: hypothetical protein VLA34_14835 [Candidatus Krumholzibacterium sp.]|nr:hypothetical protein [Candidatus Krumholzibacterium sp.]
MNSISFCGSSELIRDFVDRFLDTGQGVFEPLEETSEQYGTDLREIAGRTGADIAALERVVDFLVACDLPEADIRETLEGDEPWIVTLARDVRTLETYTSDGTILDVRIIEEI